MPIRRMLLAVCGLVGALAAFAGASAAAQTPQRGGTLVFAVNSEPPSYDCINTTTFVAMQTLSPFYSTLLKYDPDKFPEIRGDLAESWSVSADGRAYTFRLRSGVKFHDGAELTADDVRATFERIRRPTQGIVSVRQSDYEDIASIETPDARTVVFRLTAPNASMLLNFASPWNCVMRAADLARDPRAPERAVNGTGPYRLGEHSRGSHLTGQRNATYFEPGKPYLDGFRIVFMSGAAMVNALQGGQIMAEFRGLTPAERDRLVAAAPDRFKVEESPWVCKMDVYFNHRKPPFDDERVRRALTLAIDRWTGSAALSRTVFVKAVGASLRPGDALAMSDAEIEKYPGFGRDGAAAKAEARRLLQEAGQSNLRFKLVTRNVPMPFQPMAVWLIDQWRQVGVAVENTPMEVAQQKATYIAGNHEVGLDSNCVDVDDPNQMLRLYVSSTRSPTNFSLYEDATLDELFERQRRTSDAAERRRLIREFEDRYLSRSMTAPLLWWHRIVVYDKRIQGWKALPSHYLNQDLAGVWLAN